MNLIVMCNVLHEIEPTDWLTDITAVTPLIARDGVLLIVEDYAIPHGEKAHTNGFLLLDTPQLRELFCVTEADPGFQVKEERKGRLKAHLVPGECLTRVSGDSRARALESLRSQAKEHITQLRSAAPSSRNGHLHGMWTQLYANASLSLDLFRAK